MKLFGQRRGMFTMMAVILVFSLLLAACGSSNTGSSSTTPTTGSSSVGPNGKGCKKAGILLPETATSERWDHKDRPLLIADITKALGTAPFYNNAQGSATTQQTQAQADLANGACILVLAPVDSIQAASIVSAAKAKGVPVIAYDRLTYSADLNY